MDENAAMSSEPVNSTTTTYETITTGATVTDVNAPGTKGKIKTKISDGKETKTKIKDGKVKTKKTHLNPEIAGFFNGT
ncbi:MAG: hypothetical protein ACXWV9_06930 [Flavisolibacter sp.]